MTGTVAYILAKKIALGAVSGIANITLNGNQIVFQFNDGSSASMSIPLPKDGLSIVKVEIDANNHLICTMSDSSTIDAGELPGGTGGGLVQVKNKSSLPVQGEDNTLYLTQNDDTLYYWDNTSKTYKQIAGGSGADGIDFKTSFIEFDGIETTFDLPIDDKDMMIYVNGMYLTENEDYTIDRTVSPNTITFVETWEEEDLCSLVWVKGTISGSGGGTIDNASLATKADIDKLFTNVPDIDITNSTLATKADIDKLFQGSSSVDPNTSSLATKADIDKLFK